MGEIDLLFGPILIGVFLNCILFGVLVVQAFVYFQTYKGKDPLWFKIFVAYLMFCETVNTACDMYLVYEPLIMRYGTMRALMVSPIILPTDPLLTVMVSMPVQLFIAWRVKITSKSVIMPIIIAFFSIAAFIGGIASAVLVAIMNKYAEFHQFKAAPITYLASTAAADILITAALVYNLSRQRTGFAVTDELINKIIRLTVQTGMITSVFAILDVTLYLTTTGASVNFLWELPLTKLYSNSLLSTLNARGGWKATSTVRSNALFGGGYDQEATGTLSRRTQIEFVAVDPHDAGGRQTNVVSMKAFDAEASYPDRSPNDYPPKFEPDV